MTHQLITNRYGQTTPTHIQPNGCSISVPIYVTPTTDQTKQLLNGFREVVRRQRLNQEVVESTTTGVSVVTAVTAPLTPAEHALGMNEEALRYALFSRKGLPERLLIQLQDITGIQLITREAIDATYNEWLDHLGLKTNAKKGSKRTSSTSKTSKKTTSSASS